MSYGNKSLYGSGRSGSFTYPEYPAFFTVSEFPAFLRTQNILLFLLSRRFMSVIVNTIANNMIAAAEANEG